MASPPRGLGGGRPHREGPRRRLGAWGSPRARGGGRLHPEGRLALVPVLIGPGGAGTLIVAIILFVLD